MRTKVKAMSILSMALQTKSSFLSTPFTSIDMQFMSYKQGIRHTFISLLHTTVTWKSCKEKLDKFQAVNS